MNKLLSKIVGRSDTIISIQLSGRCNFRCKMCGHSMNNNGIMSDAVFDATINKCLNAGIKELRLSSSWGECTLASNWKERIEMSMKEGINVWFTTNGSRLNSVRILPTLLNHV